MANMETSCEITSKPNNATHSSNRFQQSMNNISRRLSNGPQFPSPMANSFNTECDLLTPGMLSDASMATPRLFPLTRTESSERILFPSTTYKDISIQEDVNTTSEPTTTHVVSPTNEITSTRTFYLKRTPNVSQDDSETEDIDSEDEIEVIKEDVPILTDYHPSTEAVVVVVDNENAKIDVKKEIEVIKEDAPIPADDHPSTEAVVVIVDHENIQVHVEEEIEVIKEDVPIPADDHPSTEFVAVDHENVQVHVEKEIEVIKEDVPIPADDHPSTEFVSVDHENVQVDVEEEIDEKDGASSTLEDWINSITATKFKPSRRASVAKKCEYERFSTSPYKSTNMAGFITNRPFKWVLAFLVYAKECNRNSRCKQEVDDAGACKEFTMLLQFQETKHVTVCIKLTTGYVSIKGADFQTWIDSNFHLVAKHVATEETSLEEENQQGKEEPGTETKDRSKPTKEDDKENDYITQLWEENKSLRNALAILEKAVKAMQTRECNCKNDVNEESVRRIFDEKVIELERKYDSKLMTFRNSLERDYRTEIKEAKKVHSNKTEKLRDEFVKLKQSSEAMYNGISLKVTNVEKKIVTYGQHKPATMHEVIDTEIKESMGEIEARLKEVANNIEFLKSEKRSQVTHPYNSLASEIKIVNEKLDTHVSNINQLTLATHAKLNTLIIGQMPAPPPIPSINTVNHPPLTQQNSHTPNFLTTPLVPTVTSKDTTNPGTILSVTNITCDSQKLLDGSKQQNAHQLRPDTDRFLDETAGTASASADEGSIPIPTDENTELLILIDSNSNHVDRRRFWKLDNTKWKRCGMISEAMKAIHEVKYTNLQYVLVSIGVNDTDDEEEDGLSVANRLLELLNVIKEKYPDSKIILNELTPRNDSRDNEVIKCNGALFTAIEKDNKIFLAKQSNLRDPEYTFFFDAKHIKSSKIGRYVNNIKIALRKAYGIADPRYSSVHHDRQRWNNISPTSRWSFQHDSFQPPQHPYNNRINEQRNQRTVNHQAIHDSQHENTINHELKYEIRKRLLAIFD